MSYGKVDHFDRFFWGSMIFFVLAFIVGITAVFISEFGWWTLLIPPGIVMVIAAVYGLGWAYEWYCEWQHQRSHR